MLRGRTPLSRVSAKVSHAQCGTELRRRTLPPSQLEPTAAVLCPTTALGLFADNEQKATLLFDKATCTAPEGIVADRPKQTMPSRAFVRESVTNLHLHLTVFDIGTWSAVDDRREGR